MAKLVHVTREKVEKGRRRLERLLTEDEFWQGEQKRIKKFEAQEKARREAIYAEQQEHAGGPTEISK